MKQPIQMKSSQLSNANNSQLVPQFACAIYFENGEQKLTYNVIGNYPKSDILPGLLAVAQHVKLNLLDKVAPGDENDRLLGMLEDVAEDAKASPEMEKVLKLGTLPTEENE